MTQAVENLRDTQALIAEEVAEEAARMAGTLTIGGSD